MQAVLVQRFGETPVVTEVPDPAVPADGVLVRVEATGVCRSDWHAWLGHDRDVALPHVPGHELAGVIEAVGPEVRSWAVGDRVTAPFVLACGQCAPCRAGDGQVCWDQRQPGFTHWGSFADLVALPRAETNLVRVPDDLPAVTAAALGCRYATAFRAVLDVGRVRAGEWVAVHGCGGVGLSAVQVAVAAGARVVAVDVSAAALDLARELGASVTVDGGDVAATVREATDGGAHLSLDCLGSAATLGASVRGLRTRGRHVQVGLLPPDLGHPAVPMARVVALELALLGSHGMPAHRYPSLLDLVAAGRLRPDLLVTRSAGLGAIPAVLEAMSGPGAAAGITVAVPGGPPERR